MSLPPAGLSEQEAQARLKTEGYNELPTDRGRSLGRIIFEIFREPMFGMLLAAGAIYFIIGSWHEAAFLTLFAALSVMITIVQEVRSENVLKVLRDLTSPRALVMRDGQRKRIPGREVVRGDLIFLSEGDRVPADAYLIKGTDVMADESLLTGESVPVRKKPDADFSAPLGKPGGDDLPHVFSGSLIVRGFGQAIVTDTGERSQIGKIGHALHTIEAESPRLQKETKRIVRVFGILCLVLSVTAIIAYGLLRGSWLNAVLSGIALSMALLPEEFPLVLTVFMVMGAWRISKERVLTRRASAIETLGSATVLCTDKTGTLTENRMSVVTVDAANGSEGISDLLRTAMWASKLETFDPMDVAIFHYAQQNGIAAPATTLVQQYGLQPELLAMTHVWRVNDGSLFIASKGAPETIAQLCHMDNQALDELHRRVRVLAEQGIRVLGVADAKVTENGAILPESPRNFLFEFRGLIGFADPLRKNVPASVQECHSAGIRIVMITGDYPETASAIATQAGITTGKTEPNIVTGDQLTAMDDNTLQERCRTVSVFARITPDQKLRIVKALKMDGEVVAMTGDGVNDAPALKAAHIGIAMGSRGTDVAREASSIVLLDDDFSSIVRTIRLGRRIYDNLQKAMTYIIAVHVPIAGLAMLPIFFGFPLLLTPLLIALMEMVIDPVCSIVLEAEEEESDVMSRPPRDPEAQLLPSRLISWGAFQGMTAFVVIAAVFYVTLRQQLTEDESRSLAFICLMTSNLALVFVNRSYSTSIIGVLRRRNLLLWGSLVVVPGILFILFAVPDLREIFGFTPLTINQILMATLPACILLVFLEKVKFRWQNLRQAK